MPPLDPEQLLRRLAQKKPLPAVLLLGGDLYLRDLCRAALLEAFVPEGAREWGTSRFSTREASLDVILRQAETLPMLSASQVVFVEDAEAWEKLSDTARNTLLERLKDYFQNPAPFTVLVFEALALDQRMKLFKSLSEHTLVVGIELPEKLEDRLDSAVAMTAKMARQLGVEIEAGAARELAESLEGELARIRTELEKLSAYVGARRCVTTADVDALVVSARKYSVWQLAGMLAGRQRNRALLFLDSLLREGEPAPAVVGAMAWMYRRLLEVQELPVGVNKWEVVRRLRMQPETAEIALRESRKIPRARLVAGLAALSDADNRLKFGSVNQRAVMEFLVARLTG